LVAEAADFARKIRPNPGLGATRAAADELAFRIGAAAAVHRLTRAAGSRPTSRGPQWRSALAPLSDWESRRWRHA